MVVVKFAYDETVGKWDVWVEGTATSLEARQAFSAVVLTCQQVDPDLLRLTRIEEVNDRWVITPVKR